MIHVGNESIWRPDSRGHGRSIHLVLCLCDIFPQGR